MGFQWTSLFLLCSIVVPAVASVEPGLASASSPLDLFAKGVSNQSWSLGAQVCYRIPAFLRSRTGALLAFASERLGSDCSDESGTNLVLRRSTDNGATWEPMQLIVPTGADKAEMSPWALQDASTGRIFMFSNTNVHTPTDCNCEVFYVTSDDDGQTWSNRTVVPKSTGFYGGSLVTGITHSSGRVIGCMRKICRNSCPADYRSKAFFSDDHGKTWNSSSFLTSGTTECQVAELSDGRIYMNIRPYTGWHGQKNQRLVSFSSDAGSTWGEVHPDPALIDYGFADEGSVVSDPKNKVMYFSHPDAHGRENLTLYRSLDDAQSWVDTVTVYPGPSEYSSSAILDPAPGKALMVGILFEAQGYGVIRFSSVQYRAHGSGSDLVV